ncbi:MAG: nitric oxide synthase [Methanobacterium sp.]|nr:nitric oxide synthase [Methanobacterium sp.]
MKALVIYGSRYGTAREISEKITDTLQEEKVDVDLVNSDDKKKIQIEDYDLVVAGSGIKMGKWTKNTQNFPKKNRKELANRKVALFVSCGAANEAKNRAEGQEKYLDNVAAKYLDTKPIATGLFGSVYDPDVDHGLLYKLVKGSIEKEMIKMGQDPKQKHDYRDWDAIKQWTIDLTK